MQFSRKFDIYHSVGYTPSTFQSTSSSSFSSVNPDFYVFIVFAESSDFDRSISDCDTNLFRNFTHCHVIVFSNKTSDNNAIVFIFPSLSFNANILTTVGVSSFCGTVGSFFAIEAKY